MEYLIFDTESCTGHADDGSLCSLGYVIADENFNVIKRDDILINPLPSKFFVGDKKHAKQTGITFAYSIEEFRRSPRFDALYDKIANLFKDRLALGFSIVNDLRYLNDACVKYSLPIINYKFLDVQYIYKLIHPEENAVGLKILCEKYGCEYLAHRADEDAFATLTLLKKILDEKAIDLHTLLLKYGVVLGTNDTEGYVLNYSYSVIKKEFGLKPSNKVLLSIYSDFVKNLIPEKNKTIFCFSHKTERKYPDRLLSMIDYIYKKGFCFTKEVDSCDFLITTDNEEIENPKAITFEEFERKTGFNQNYLFNDEKLLELYYLKPVKHDDYTQKKQN